MNQAKPMPLLGAKSEPSCSLIWFGQFEIRAHQVNPAAVQWAILLICPVALMAPGISVCANRKRSGTENEKF